MGNGSLWSRVLVNRVAIDTKQGFTRSLRTRAQQTPFRLTLGWNALPSLLRVQVSQDLGVWGPSLGQRCLALPGSLSALLWTVWAPGREGL